MYLYWYWHAPSPRSTSYGIFGFNPRTHPPRTLFNSTTQKHKFHSLRTQPTATSPTRNDSILTAAAAEYFVHPSDTCLPWSFLFFFFFFFPVRCRFAQPPASTRHTAFAPTGTLHHHGSNTLATAYLDTIPAPQSDNIENQTRMRENITPFNPPKKTPTIPFPKKTTRRRPPHSQQHPIRYRCRILCRSPTLSDTTSACTCSP